MTPQPTVSEVVQPSGCIGVTDTSLETSAQDFGTRLDETNLTSQVWPNMDISYALFDYVPSLGLIDDIVGIQMGLKIYNTYNPKSELVGGDDCLSFSGFDIDIDSGKTEDNAGRFFTDTMEFILICL